MCIPDDFLSSRLMAEQADLKRSSGYAPHDDHV